MSKISLKHSGGNVVSLNSPTNAPAQADVAFKLPNEDGSASQAMITDGSGNLSFASVAGAGRAKNLIINGDMSVAQRATSSTALYYQSIDRFRTSFGNIGSIDLTQSQQSLTSSDTPYSSGFRYFYRAALSGAGSVNANGYIGISQRLEARDVAQSGWDYTSATSNITIQFWFRCSTNQTFYMALTSQDGTSQSYVFSFTASGNNAWTKITKTIPGAANVQFDTDTLANGAARGLTVSFTPWYGTDYTGTKALNQWSAYSGSAEYPDYASTWLTAGASTFDITGVQLEVGDSATDYEHLTFAENLRKCQRYYFRIPYQGVCNSGGSHISVGIETGSQSRQCVIFPQVMRALPACAASNLYSDDEQSVTSANTVALVYGSVSEPDRARVAFSGGSYSSGQVATIVTNGTTNTYLEGDAEI